MDDGSRRERRLASSSRHTGENWYYTLTRTSALVEFRLQKGIAMKSRSEMRISETKTLCQHSALVKCYSSLRNAETPCRSPTGILRRQQLPKRSLGTDLGPGTHRLPQHLPPGNPQRGGVLSLEQPREQAFQVGWSQFPAAHCSEGRAPTLKVGRPPTPAAAAP